MPLVSVIIPTIDGRRDFLARALDCFHAQKWARKQLVVVRDDPSPAPRLTIGEKRNRACALADGEFIIHFDDDDFSAPGRIADQIIRLTESGKAVTGYHTMRFTDGVNWWRNGNRSPWAFGASLCYRRDWWEQHPFPPLQLGEDRDFVQTSAKFDQLITADAGDMMYATNHPGNTSQRVIGEGWDPCEAFPGC